MCPVTCVTGIDTDIGKTYATGLMARALMDAGCSVITQKVVQTGCTAIADDIVKHRELMGVELLPEDTNGLSCPYVFKKPCSPHLAAELEDSHIDPTVITAATKKLATQYDQVLLEGAGGLLVPLTNERTFLDYLQERDYPLILVASPRLGSINHTLSALELARGRGLSVKGIVYNCYENCDETICNDSRNVFLAALLKYGFAPVVVDMLSAAHYQKSRAVFNCLELFEL